MNVIEVTPASELKFDFNAVSVDARERTLTIKNISEKNVAVKIKTTAPASYLVRPSNGFLKSNGSITIYIQLRTGNHLKPGEKKVNHRFQVQATPVAGEENLKREDWQGLDKDQIQEVRFAVVPEGVEEDPESMQRRYNDKLSSVSLLEKEVLTLQSQVDAVDLELKKGKGTSMLFSWPMVIAIVLALVLTKIPFLVSELQLR